MQISTGKPALDAAIAHFLAITGLALISFLTIYRSFGEFGFYYDDWRFLQEAAQVGSVEQVFATRPLHRPLTEWVFNTVGFNPTTGYVLLAVMLIASVLAMYWVMNVLFPRRRSLAIISTAIYVLYPGDLTRTWITAGLTGNRPAVLMALIAVGLLFTGLRLRRRSENWFRGLMAASIGIYFVSLMIYEAQALLVPGMALLGGVWIGMSGRGLMHRSMAHQTVRDALMVTAPYVLVFLAVVAWRSFLVQTGTEDRFTEAANFSPLYLIWQLIGAYYFNFLEQPVEVLVTSVPFLGQMPLGVLFMALFAAALVIVPVAYFARRINRVIPKHDPRDAAALAGETLIYRRLTLVGLALTGLTYLVLLPHDHFIYASGLAGPDVSRLNAAAAVVVSITFAAAIMFAWSWSMMRWRLQRMRVNYAVGGVTVVAIVLLVTFHGIVQEDYAEAWELQQRYAQQVTDQVPAVEPGTHFHFEGVPAQHGSSYVFMYSLMHMLRLTYDDETITATTSPAGDARFVASSPGLYLDGQLIAERDGLLYFTLVPGACEDSGVSTECGRLVLSAPVELNGSLVSAAPGDSPVNELLGIEPVPGNSAIGKEPSQPPLFGAPSEPPEE